MVVIAVKQTNVHHCMFILYEQLRQNIKASELKLSGEELQSLNKLSVSELPFPYNLLKGAEDLLQAGTTVNGIKSNIAKILPLNDSERHK